MDLHYFYCLFICQAQNQFLRSAWLAFPIAPREILLAATCHENPGPRQSQSSPCDIEVEYTDFLWCYEPRKTRTAPQSETTIRWLLSV